MGKYIPKALGVKVAPKYILFDDLAAYLAHREGLSIEQSRSFLRSLKDYVILCLIKGYWIKIIGLGVIKTLPRTIKRIDGMVVEYFIYKLSLSKILKAKMLENLPEIVKNLTSTGEVTECDRYRR